MNVSSPCVLPPKTERDFSIPAKVFVASQEGVDVSPVTPASEAGSIPIVFNTPN